MTPPRSVGNDSELFIENNRVRFAMWCDENGLSLDEGRELADLLADEIRNCADYRATYLGDGLDD